MTEGLNTSPVKKSKESWKFFGLEKAGETLLQPFNT